MLALPDSDEPDCCSSDVRRAPLREIAIQLAAADREQRTALESDRRRLRRAAGEELQRKQSAPGLPHDALADLLHDAERTVCGPKVRVPRAGTNGACGRRPRHPRMRTKPTAHWSLVRWSMCATSCLASPV